MKRSEIPRKPPRLKPRLLAAAAQVRPGSVAADVGTDHGYLACYLAGRGICSRVYASDVNPGPLAAAEKNVRASGLEERVVLLLSDGVKSLPLEEITDVVVAGMGGDLILSIIGDERLRDPEKRLVLQPMTKAEVLRRGLARLGFSLCGETAVRDGRFVYTVLAARFTGEKREIGDAEAFAGLLKGETAEEREYLSRVGKRLENRRDGEKDEQEKERLSRLISEIKERIEDGDGR